MGAVWRSMALMGVAGRCGGGDDSTVFKRHNRHHNGPKHHGAGELHQEPSFLFWRVSDHMYTFFVVLVSWLWELVRMPYIDDVEWDVLV